MLYSGVFTCCNQGGRVLSPWNLSVELPYEWVGLAKKMLNYSRVLTPYFLWLFSGADTLLRKFILRRGIPYDVQCQIYFTMAITSNIICQCCIEYSFMPALFVQLSSRSWIMDLSKLF